MNASSEPLNAALAIDDAALREFARKLKLLLPNGSKLSDSEALAGAEYARATGLDPFRGEFFIVPGIGVVQGYKGVLARQARQGREPDYRYRPLTEDEQDWHDIQSGDKAVVCYATDPAEAAEARRQGREPRVWQGVGVVRKAEQWESWEWRKTPDGKSYKFALPEAQWKKRLNPPQGRSWGWVAQNRALRDCANHMGIAIPPDGETVLAQAAAAGIEVSTPARELSGQQAAALVAEQIAAHVRQVAPPPADQVQARAAANIALMRGPKTADPLGIDAPPSALAAEIEADAPAEEYADEQAPAAEIEADAPAKEYADEQAPAQVGETDPAPNDTQRAAMEIKARILRLARDNGPWKAAPCNEAKRAVINRGWAILIPQDERRRAIRQYLLDHDSSTYTEGECAALLGWFDIKKTSSGAIPGVQALAEVKILAAALGLNEDLEAQL